MPGRGRDPGGDRAPGLGGVRRGCRPEAQGLRRPGCLGARPRPLRGRRGGQGGRHRPRGALARLRPVLRGGRAGRLRTAPGGRVGGRRGPGPRGAQRPGAGGRRPGDRARRRPGLPERHLPGARGARRGDAPAGRPPPSASPGVARSPRSRWRPWRACHRASGRLPCTACCTTTGRWSSTRGCRGLRWRWPCRRRATSRRTPASSATCATEPRAHATASSEQNTPSARGARTACSVHSTGRSVVTPACRPPAPHPPATRPGPEPGRHDELWQRHEGQQGPERAVGAADVGDEPHRRGAERGERVAHEEDHRGEAGAVPRGDGQAHEQGEPQGEAPALSGAEQESPEPGRTVRGRASTQLTDPPDRGRGDDEHPGVGHVVQHRGGRQAGHELGPGEHGHEQPRRRTGLQPWDS